MSLCFRSNGRSLILLLCFAVLPAFGQDIATFVTADDGTLLSTDVYLPEGTGPWPAILMRTPYGDRKDEGPCTAHVAQGYACVVQDQRGFGESEGENYFWEHDGGDGRITVAWISEQPWCNGNVGTRGGSATAFPQYLLAPGAPEALKCMAPEVSTPNLHHHWAFPGGVLREELIVLTAQTLGIGWMVDELSQHRLRDGWWDEMQRPIIEAQLVTIPGLHIGGWYDVFSQGTLDAFSTFQSQGGDGALDRQTLIMGPWRHDQVGRSSAGFMIYPDNASVDVEEVEHAWHDHWLKGEDSGVDRWPPVSVYLMGAAWSPIGIFEEPEAPGNRWVALQEWPPPSRTLELYPESDGRLSRVTPPEGELELLIDPSDPVPTLGTLYGGPRDLRPVESRDDVLVFTTDELTRPVTVMGRVSCHLWVRPDTADLDLAVQLSDVYPSGHSMLVIDGIQRARIRCGDDRECLLTPGEPAEIIVDLWSTALVFNAGHRIRISVSGSNSPRFEVNPNHGGAFDGDEPPVIAHPDLLFGPEHPSRLELPIPLWPPRHPSGRAGG